MGLTVRLVPCLCVPYLLFTLSYFCIINSHILRCCFSVFISRNGNFRNGKDSKVNGVKVTLTDDGVVSNYTGVTPEVKDEKKNDVNVTDKVVDTTVVENANNAAKDYFVSSIPVATVPVVAITVFVISPLLLTVVPPA